MSDMTGAFKFEGKTLSCERYGSGHINETYLVTTDKRRYILQKINTGIFKKPEELMSNISGVLSFIGERMSDPREAMRLVPTLEGRAWSHDERGDYRAYEFVEDTICLDRAESESDFYESAVGFGNFQRMLADYPAHTLFETIPRFHDTPNRYEKLRAAIAADSAGRVREVMPEIDFALAREAEAGLVMNGGLPLRVTHNDTKLNNVLLDKTTRKAMCVIDLDTVMPGFAVNDFGDSIRFGASTAAEDEDNLELVSMSLRLFETYARGFLGACSLTPAERELLPMAAKLMTLECGVRFLTDYIEGDVYFRIHRPRHNVSRARTQFKLVSDMENKWAEMAGIIGGIK